MVSTPAMAHRDPTILPQTPTGLESLKQNSKQRKVSRAFLNDFFWSSTYYVVVGVVIVGVRQVGQVVEKNTRMIEVRVESGERVREREKQRNHYRSRNKYGGELNERRGVKWFWWLRGEGLG